MLPTEAYERAIAAGAVPFGCLAVGARFSFLDERGDPVSFCWERVGVDDERRNRAKMTFVAWPDVCLSGTPRVMDPWELVIPEARTT